MFTYHKYEGKNIEDLKKIASVELNSDLDNIFLIEDVLELGLFKGKKVIIEATTKDEIKNYIKDFINNLSRGFNMKINSEIRFNEKNIEIMLVSDNNNILIGYNGKNLNALQVLLRQSLKNLDKLGFKIVIDVSNYRSKKMKSLESQIKKICKEILETKVEVKLDPMNSYERRIVHSVVSNYENLKSESFGEEPNRYTIIKYKD